MIQCPPNFACEVHCEGDNACHDATVRCQASLPCDVICSGSNACHSTAIECAGGVCGVACLGDVFNTCHDAQLLCGSNDSRLDCEFPNDQPVAVDGGSACACETLNCD